MKVMLRHPVPGRLRPWQGRGPGKLVAYAIETPVEIPEVPRGLLAPTHSYHLLSKRNPREFAIHAGRCWEVVTGCHLGISGSEIPASPADVAEALASPGGGALRRQGTPLAARRVPGIKDVAGEGIARAAMARLADDHADGVRAAAAAHVRERMATDGTLFYAARPMPVLEPEGQSAVSFGGFGLILDEPPRTFRNATFEPSRLASMGGYLAAIGGPAGETKACRTFRSGFSTTYPYEGEDLAVFANDAPRIVGHLAASFGERLPADELRTLSERIERLSTPIELGLVGAIPVDGRADAVALARDAAAILGHAAPDETYRSILLRLLAYADHVALPALRGGPPEEDLADLAALAPSP